VRSSSGRRRSVGRHALLDRSELARQSRCVIRAQGREVCSSSLAKMVSQSLVKRGRCTNHDGWFAKGVCREVDHGVVEF
jgi:hypothetical protein